MVEQTPRMEGRQMFMILAPNPKVAQRARDLAAAAGAGEAKKLGASQAEAGRRRREPRGAGRRRQQAPPATPKAARR